MNLDFDKLRKNLIDYFGSAMSNFPLAIVELSQVECADEEELICIAQKNGFDLNDYII